HGFSQNILIELDYTNEAYHARLLRHKMQKLPNNIHIPMVYDDWSTTSVLTQERVAGVKITDVAAIDAAGIDREELALNFFRALLQQLLFDGFFHADPHPGNVWVELQTGQIIFLDMGMMGHLGRNDRFVLGRLIWALQDRDARMVTRNMVAMCVATNRHDAAALEYDVERLINRHLLLASTPPEITAIINDMVGLLMRHDLRLRKEFTLAFKAMGQGETIMRALMGDKSPDAILDITYTTMKERLLAQFRSQDLVATGKPMAREVADRLPELLIATSALLDDFQRGRTPLLPGQREIGELTDNLQQSVRQGVRRIVMSVLLAGLLIGSSLVLLTPLEGRVSEYEALAVRLIAVSGFVISAAAILIMLLAITVSTLQQRTDN
ncbi:MAG: AarF/ABC1/UbiB kinase family protein, partial [Candidatus Promineofilum sp.]|nr:AarF/ABC1/UbiB kinase family protein [Promineifilum sp.]